MSVFPIASTSIIGVFVLGTFAAIFVGTLLILDRRHNPLHKLARFRVRCPQGVRFDRLTSASIGYTPTRQSGWRYTLSVALDSDWVYLRLSRVVPFFPVFWRLPRKQVRPLEDDYWTIRIHSFDPPLNADFGTDFVAALRRQKS